MFLSFVLALACVVADDGDVQAGDTADSGGSDGGDTDSADAGSDLDPVCTEPSEVGCIDEMILDLSLHDDLVSDGDVSNDKDGDDWVSVVDASAGGMYDADKNPWIYLRFTDDGLERVDIDDETALEEMTWHLSARRYILRLNSGTSGPSCVGGAEVKGDYADVTTSDAEGADYNLEHFYDEECKIIEDNSNLPGSLDVVLGGWWDYVSCVATTAQAFVIQLDDGRLLKFTVEQYYKGDGQDECNNEGSTNKESGIFTFRWRFLE